MITVHQDGFKRMIKTCFDQVIQKSAWRSTCNLILQHDCHVHSSSVSIHSNLPKRLHSSHIKWYCHGYCKVGVAVQGVPLKVLCGSCIGMLHLNTTHPLRRFWKCTTGGVLIFKCTYILFDFSVRFITEGVNI